MGHNRGWEEAATMLSGSPIELKTCNAALLEATGKSWNEVCVRHHLCELFTFLGCLENLIQIRKVGIHTSKELRPDKCLIHVKLSSYCSLTWIERSRLKVTDAAPNYITRMQHI